MSDNSEEPPVESNLSFIFRVIVSILIIDAILFVATGLVCYFVGWRTWEGFSNGLFFAGFLVMALDYLTSSRATKEVLYLAFLTLLRTGEPLRVSYPIAMAGFILIVLSLLVGLLI